MGSRIASGDLRSASFSEYLKHRGGGCARHRADSLPEYELPLPVLPRKVGPSDQEIDVFDAKKYFSANSDAQAARDKKENHIQGRKPGTLGLIPETLSSVGNPFRESGIVDLSNQKTKNGGTRSQGILSGFSCIGYCSDAKSVQVGQESLIKKSSSHQILSENPGGANVSRSDRTEGFEFPILNTGEPVEEQPRDSLDVFGSYDKARAGGAVAVNLERKIPMLTWDAIPKAQSLPLPPRFDAARVDDSESCASSDLFEIESISAMCRDGISTLPRTEALQEKDVQKRCGLSRFSLLGCKSYKSVNVAEPGKKT